MFRLAFFSALSICSVTAAQSPLVVNHYVPFTGEPEEFNGLPGVFTDIPPTVRTVTVPKGTAVIAWTFKWQSADLFLLRPRIGGLSPNKGLPTHVSSARAPHSGSWATPVEAGEVSVGLQFSFLAGNGVIVDANSSVTWTLIVFPDAPSHGLSCWDLNENHEPDPSTEDVNGDGMVDVLDCRAADGADRQNGSDGADGQDGLDGLSCWDLDRDGQADPEEEANRDGLFTALDCQGPPGPAVHTSAVCYKKHNPNGTVRLI